MDQVVHGVQDNSFVAPSKPPPSTSTDSFVFNLNKVSSSVMLIIIILAIIFLISSLLHFLVKFILRPSNRDSDEIDNVTALQGQLQQLFHLHDAGLDQSFIDTLPIFNYKEIIGVKNNCFDCSVCLCEFELTDNLRLLPDCSHAFHMECIDTWLLSHSTCPLCRANLLPDFSLGDNSIIPNELERTNSIVRVNSHFEEEENKQMAMLDSSEKVVQVKLGNFKNVDFQEGEGSNSNKNDIDSRRCFSMGSFAYVLDETTALHVPIKIPKKKKSTTKSTLPLTQGHKLAMSECGCDSRREFDGFEAFRLDERVKRSEHFIDNSYEKKVLGGSSNKESFSMSKIWSRGKKDEVIFAKDVDVSRKAFSEIDIGRWECEAKAPSLSRT